MKSGNDKLTSQSLAIMSYANLNAFHFRLVHVQISDINEAGEGVWFDDCDCGVPEIQMGDAGQSAERERSQSSRRNTVQMNVFHFRQSPKCVGLQRHHGSGMSNLRGEKRKYGEVERESKKLKASFAYCRSCETLVK